MLSAYNFLPGKTYRARKPRTIRDPHHPLCGTRNDRKILRIENGFVFFSSPAVMDFRPSKLTVEAFLKWADSLID